MFENIRNHTKNQVIINYYILSSKINYYAVNFLFVLKQNVHAELKYVKVVD